MVIETTFCQTIASRKPCKRPANRPAKCLQAKAKELTEKCVTRDSKSTKDQLMWQQLKMFLQILPVFLLLDLTWLGVVMKSFYQREIGDLARKTDGALAPRWGPAILVYILIPAGIVLFVKPLLQSNATYLNGFRWGAIYGLVLYGVYDLTNRAVLRDWSLTMTVVDIVWGCVLCGTVAMAMKAMD